MKYIPTTGSFKRLFSLKPSLPLSQTQIQDFQCEPAHHSHTKPTWRTFSFQEIFIATHGFCPDKMVGKGGYAEVYRGTLEDGEAIAVKRLTRESSDERKEKEFLNEIGTLGHVHHPNVASLLGCCFENGLYLVFHFSARGSVASLLHDESVAVMDWKTRYKIAVGTGRGLHYLHKVCPRRIIHRDIKTSNVLVTSDFEPQICDFGLAKWLPSEWSHHSIVPIEGSFGHLAPEYFMHGIVDEKTDVFAFGVFLLEVITGRKAVDGRHESLHSWAKPMIKKGGGGGKMIVDARLKGEYDEREVERLAFAASLCIRSSSASRPTITKVLEEMVQGGEVMDKNKEDHEEEEEECSSFWGFEDELNCDDDDDDDGDASSISTSSQQTTTF